tara:strand:- start:48752 stop:49726 length:975 start_codon:yes stop_codon:yes gene_type:complete
MIVSSGLLIGLLGLTLITSIFLNLNIFQLINQNMPGGSLFWLNLTHLGDAAVAVTLFSALLYKHRKWLCALTISILFSVIIVQGLKHTFDAPRPPAKLPVDQIRVLTPTLQDSVNLNMKIDYEKLVDNRVDISAVWALIQSDPSSKEALYWVPRMNGQVTKEQFGIAFSKESLALKEGTYGGIYRPSNRSFPSGHSASIICAITLLLLYLKKNRWSLILPLIGIVVAATRVVIGVHWPLDIAVGGLIGYVIALLGIWISQNTSVASWIIIREFNALLPFAASIYLIFRPPVYPEVMLLEIICGGTALAFVSLKYWQQRIKFKKD